MNCSRVKLQRVGRAIAAVAIAAMAFAAPACAGAFSSDMAWPGLDREVTRLGAYRGGVVAFGSFTLADGVPVSHLAWWKDGRWQALGSGWALEGEGTYSQPFVSRLAEWRDRLVIVGRFQLVTDAGDTLYDLAAFDGVTWRGFDDVAAVTDTFYVMRADTLAAVPYPTRELRDICVWRDRLYLVGRFTLAPDPVPVLAAAWDGAHWSPLDLQAPDGFRADYLAATSRELCMSGSIHAYTADYGAFVSLLYDGATTLAVPGFPATQEGVIPVAWHDSLWCTDWRRTDYKYFGGIAVLHRLGVSRWDSVTALTTSSTLRLLALDDGLLFTGGHSIAPCDSCPADRATVLWTARGFTPFPSGGRWIDDVSDAVSIAGHSYVAVSTLSGARPVFLGEMRGGTFEPLTARAGDRGAQGPVLALSASAGRLWRQGDDFGEPPAWWDGSAWREPDGAPLTERAPLSEPSDAERVALLPLADGRVLASGGYPSFTGAGRGVVFEPGETYGTEVPVEGGPCVAITAPGGGVALGGSMRVGGGIALGAIGVWRAGVMDALGGGVTAAPGAAPAWIGALLARGRSLVAGGWFARAGAVLASSISEWDGAAWHSLGSGVQGDSARVEAVCEWRGDLIAAGSFTAAGGAAAANIARWNGHAWSALGDGLDGPVFALAEYDGDLIAGGAFTHSGAVPVPGLARFRDGAWHALDDAGGGVFDGAVRALAVWQGTLYAAGTFRTARSGGVTQPASYLARWSDSGAFAPDAPPRHAARILRVTGLPTVRLSRVTYDLPQDGEVRVTLYDVAGRAAREITHGWQTAGRHAAEWRADDPALSPGVYQLAIDAEGERVSRAVVVLR